MILVIIAGLILLLKVTGVAPVANLSWWWVMSPWIVVLLWWEVIAPMVGWDKKEAERRMKEDERAAQELKKKNRGF